MPARASASARARQDDRPLVRVRAIKKKKNQRRRWATNRSLISQVASFKFKEWRTGQKPCGPPDRFYIIASFGISRPHRLEAPGANPGFELRARASLAGADRCEGGKKSEPAEVTIIRVSRMGDEGEAEEVAETNGQSPSVLWSLCIGALTQCLNTFINGVGASGEEGDSARSSQ